MKKGKTITITRTGTMWRWAAVHGTASLASVACGSAGLFWFVGLEDQGSFAAGTEVTADRKAEDRVLGEKQEGSDGDAVYAGPSLRATWNDRLSAMLAWTFPCAERPGHPLASV